MIAERTRAQQKGQPTVESEIPFELIRPGTSNPMLEEKEEYAWFHGVHPRYRQFVQGVLFDDNERESMRDSSDEEFVPPNMEQEERVGVWNWLWWLVL